MWSHHWTGYFRFEHQSAALFTAHHWPKLLENGHPLLVAYAGGKTFASYEYGVYDGGDCATPDHAMVVIGHSRLDNQEYWLLRNSFGETWGEKGYFKLAKSATEKCIEYNGGVVLGTGDGKNFGELKKNELNGDAMSRLKSN